MTKFQPGKTYYCRSACNYDCIWTFKVAKRTDKRLTLVDRDGKTRVVGVKQYSDCEMAFPLGRYSMAPTLMADRVSA